VKVDSFTGQVWRPNMLGALVAKAAAYTVPTDPGRTRHVTDFAILSTMIRRNDRLETGITPRDRHYLDIMLRDADRHRPIWAAVDGADRGLDLLKRFTADGQ